MVDSSSLRYCIWFLLFKISIEYKYHFEGHEIELCIGTEDSCFLFFISTKVPNFYVLRSEEYPSCFDPSKSKTFFKTSMSMGNYLHDDYISGDMVGDDIIIPKYNAKIEHFHFILVNSGIKYTKYCGVLGISGKNDENYNFLFQLIRAGYLKKPTVIINKHFIAFDDCETSKKGKRGLIYRDSYNEGILVVHSPSSMLVDNKKGFFTEIEDKKQEIHFRIDTNKINIPLTLFEFLDEKYFNVLDERGSKVCTRVITGEPTKKIVCKKDFRNYLNLTSHYIFLFINKGSFRINLDDMFVFEPLTKKYVFLLQNSEKYERIWILGMSILEKYQMEIDFFNKEMYFSSIT